MSFANSRIGLVLPKTCLLLAFTGSQPEAWAQTGDSVSVTFSQCIADSSRYLDWMEKATPSDSDSLSLVTAEEAKVIVAIRVGTLSTLGRESYYLPELLREAEKKGKIEESAALKELSSRCNVLFDAHSRLLHDDMQRYSQHLGDFHVDAHWLVKRRYELNAEFDSYSSCPDDPAQLVAAVFESPHPTNGRNLASVSRVSSPRPRRLWEVTNDQALSAIWTETIFPWTEVDRTPDTTIEESPVIYWTPEAYWALGATLLALAMFSCFKRMSRTPSDTSEKHSTQPAKNSGKHTSKRHSFK